ncbi:MAG: hypothetical protein Kapaf2KO_22520 [Candidatus Kapaibacteriales bacterium]
MIKASKPQDESERLDALDTYGILDTLPEKCYDDLTALAANICGTEISLVSLIDKNRQWFKSRHGLDVESTPREIAFCSHAILEPYNLFEVEDASKDERFHDNPLVTGEPKIRYYGGFPLVDETGFSIRNTLCN